MTPGIADFVVPVDKPEGPTSHDIVAAARKGLGTRRVGHCGTLDPFASGVLLLCVGKSTRIAEYLSGLDKTYEAVARLGVTTDTLDREGQVVAESQAWHALDAERVASALQGLAGDVAQVPPQFSAKKVDGESMHRRARRGEHVELEPSAVSIYEIRLLSLDLPDVSFAVRCSSGTYIRAIARDLGEALGVGAHLTRLRRTSVGRFHVNASLPVDALADPTRVRAEAVSPLDALSHLPAIEIDAEVAARVNHGQKIRLLHPSQEGLVAVAYEGALHAIGEVEAGVLKPRKVFSP